jgi:hypothetical protein
VRESITNLIDFNSAGSAIPGLSRVMVYLLKVEAEIILR